MSFDLGMVRNIGISAHIDSGKTTLTERILFYSNRIHAIHEVRGKDGVGATMDSMELERERGITIASAATHVDWEGHHINIIDTPGHVDFTIEVERSLRVLDGAVLILCSVAGVQSQSITVDRQMKRYKVPRIAFVNKCDRSGANPFRVTEQLSEKLGHNAVMIQIPIGLEADHDGIVDLVTMKAVYFDGENGEVLREEEIPANLLPEAETRREMLLDAASMFSEEMMEAMLEGSPSEEMIHEAIRKGTLDQELTPVLLGSAYKNKGVQKLMNAVLRYLPNPTEVVNEAIHLEKGKEGDSFRVSNDPGDPLLSLAFKLEDGQYGQLTYIRIYQGSLIKGDTVINSRSGQKVKIGRLVRMHADKMEDIDKAEAGDIIALFGVDCASGDSFCAPGLEASMASMFVPEPVISLSVKPEDKKSQDNMSKALQRFTKEDPTFRVGTNEETGDTIIQGMGELHLEVYIERMKREYKATVEVSPPQVAYRETISRSIDFDYTHKKQTGGSGQYGKVVGRIEPSEDTDFEFVNDVTGGNIPTEYISAVEKGFKSALEKGMTIGAPVTGIRVILQDGNSHAVDSSDMAFMTAARNAFREYYQKGKPRVLEPLMLVSVETPREFQGDAMGTLMQRRAIVLGTTEDEGFIRMDAEVPLAEMFGYATVLRSVTQGKASFTMEFKRYSPAPAQVAEDLHKEYLEKRKEGK
ncbi:MAG: elongation factor G [Candidatus Krumholzibacteria bacterium]|jgi:elongation factor G|nr:elongation factor G [Candidatus Krumholzibacteria bacterium]MDP7022042.1 elongation factor G [Candidatus Krumholzibacteria bacterium]